MVKLSEGSLRGGIMQILLSDDVLEKVDTSKFGWGEQVKTDKKVKEILDYGRSITDGSNREDKNDKQQSGMRKES